MAKVTIQANGAKIARSPGFNAAPEKRGAISGWSRASARRNDDFLRSVDALALDGLGVSFSLTVRDFPESHVAWERIRRSFIKRVERLGLVRLHWLTEFQRRGAPHLHGIAYFPTGTCSSVQDAVIIAWLKLTAELGTSSRGQHSVLIRDISGWLKYLGKHGSRGVNHYQRSADLPTGWEKTGRLWGKCGEWPVQCDEYFVQSDLFFKIRRFVTRVLLSEARSDVKKYSTQSGPEASYRLSEAKKRITYLRTRCRAPERKLSELRGFSDWCDPSLIEKFLSANLDDTVRPWADRPTGRCGRCFTETYALSSHTIKTSKEQKDLSNETFGDCRVARSYVLCADCYSKRSGLAHRATFVPVGHTEQKT